MDKIKITGNGPLNGEIEISGAKNACLTLMPLTLLTDAPITLDNFPSLADTRTMGILLGELGTKIETHESGRSITLTTPDLTSVHADYDIVRKMRASILVLGPLLAREGYAQVSLPGGCAIGTRPIDFHLLGLRKLGAEIDLKDGYVEAKAPHGLKGNIIEFPKVSVGATENLLMAACLAKGVTVLKNAAQEPEITDLIECLTGMGAKIDGTGTSVLTIEGVETLTAYRHSILPDRIEAGTYMMVPAITGGAIELLGVKRYLVEAAAQKLELAGVSITQTQNSLKVSRGPERLSAVDVTTAPYPDFPTDLQAQIMAALCTAKGTSQLCETVFENRFMHVPELTRMGAKIDVNGGTATLTGVETLRGAPVMATDLRASISLILAGLAAEGETVVSRVYHLDRGYHNVEKKLKACGAIIERVRE